MSISPARDDYSQYLEALGYALRPWSTLLPASPAHGMTAPAEAASDWTRFQNELLACRDCQLSDSRKKVLVGQGNPSARLMFVAEAPLENEEDVNEVFIGPAGDLLTKMITAMGLTRADVFITHAVKCRPPENRSPTSEESESCLKHLWAQIKMVDPEVIVLLGTFASQNVLKSKSVLSELRGSLHTREDLKRSSGQAITLVPTFHPAYLLREASMKKAAWEDLQSAMRKLAENENPSRGT